MINLKSVTWRKKIDESKTRRHDQCRNYIVHDQQNFFKKIDAR